MFIFQIVVELQRWERRIKWSSGGAYSPSTTRFSASISLSLSKKQHSMSNLMQHLKVKIKSCSVYNVTLFAISYVNIYLYNEPPFIYNGFEIINSFSIFCSLRIWKWEVNWQFLVAVVVLMKMKLLVWVRIRNF